MAAAALIAPVMAEGTSVGSGGVDILKDGIFETGGSAFQFPANQNTNIDTLAVGNDKALAFGTPWQKNYPATATNNLEIKKNQDSGVCKTCCENGSLDACAKCVDPCTPKVNIEQINVGNREALAFGFASATNNVKIVTNQR
jgi:hypothetical protein